MNINSVLTQYDAMFGKTSLEQIEEFLYGKICEAVQVGDDGAIITLLNEMIGLCRDTSQKEKALAYAEQLKNLLDRMNLAGTESYATSMQNIANAYRAFGQWDEALKSFELIEKTYQQYLEKDNILWPSLYNNWGLLYQEQQEHEKAVQTLKKALSLIEQIAGTEIKQAITKGNLANSLLQLCKERHKKGADVEPELAEAYNHIRQALDIYEADEERDFHYGAALAAMGDYLVAMQAYQPNDSITLWKKAKDYYRKGLVEILIHTGITEGYQRVLEKYEMTEEKIAAFSSNLWISNLQRSKEFYLKFGVSMIHEKFSQYEDRIAVGLVGEGSDCFGFDDEISTDHDYEVGFCMWLIAEDYEKIGKELHDAYKKLVEEHVLEKEKDNLTEKGSRNSQQKRNNNLHGRRGVFEISSFYQESILNQQYTKVEESKLAELVNGEVFRDDLGLFTVEREKLLSYYPEEIWRKKLATLLHEFAQFGQSNYARMMAREDYVTATLCIGKTIESAMDIAYVLLRKYAPYYKWKRKGLESIAKGRKDALRTGGASESQISDSFIRPLLWVCEELAQLPCQKKAWKDVPYDATQLNINDKAVVLVELLAKLLLKEMMEQNLVRGKDTFLEVYMTQILEEKKNLVDQIVQLEWQQFDKVKNEGGRADCQDNFPTFSIMRKSQYLTWDEQLLRSYLTDLERAQRDGWNLITEKYARMMKSTAPERYAELEEQLPPRSEERQAIAEEIIKIQVAWMEEFASKYPKMAGNARSIHTYEDTAFNTSYETYLRGELGTYSEETFVLYGRFITELLKKGINLAYETMSQTARLYGYKSVEDAENRL